MPSKNAPLTGQQESLTLVFDGNCGFCTRCVGLLCKLDRKRRILLVPSQSPGLAEELNLTAQQCQQSAWAVEPSGHKHDRAGAVLAALVWAVGLPNLLRLYYLPGVKKLGDVVYDLVARNRHRLPGVEPYCQQFPEQCGEGSKDRFRV